MRLQTVVGNSVERGAEKGEDPVQGPTYGGRELTDPPRMRCALVNCLTGVRAVGCRLEGILCQATTLSSSVITCWEKSNLH